MQKTRKLIKWKIWIISESGFWNELMFVMIRWGITIEFSINAQVSIVKMNPPSSVLKTDEGSQPYTAYWLQFHEIVHLKKNKPVSSAELSIILLFLWNLNFFVDFQMLGYACSVQCIFLSIPVVPKTIKVLHFDSEGYSITSTTNRKRTLLLQLLLSN